MAHIRLLASFAVAGGLLLPIAAFAHGDKAKKAASAPEQKPWGIAGDANKATRTVKIDMRDEMKYFPSVVTVKLGETVRFEVKNSGHTMHEFVIGTKAELDEHAALMKKFPGMEHDEAYMAHVTPGKADSIVWRFNRAGEFFYACLLPGHYEAGMVGKVIVKQ